MRIDGEICLMNIKSGHHRYDDDEDDNGDEDCLICTFTLYF